MIRTESKAKATQAASTKPLPWAPKLADDEVRLTAGGKTSVYAQVGPNRVARVGRPSSGKQVVSIRLDPDVIAKFKATGDGWQARMNDVLMAVKV